MSHVAETLEARSPNATEAQASDRLMESVITERQNLIQNLSSAETNAAIQDETLDFGTTGDLYGTQEIQEAAPKDILKEQAIAFGLSNEFMQNMHAFEERAGSSDEDKAAIESTYENISRLLDSKDGNLNLEERVRLAEEMMQHAADPLKVNQGNYNMCVAAALEGKLWLEHPERASKIITEAALYSAFTMVDGSVVQLDEKSLRSRYEPTITGLENVGHRDVSEQILQTAILNSFLEYKGLQYSLVEPNSPTSTGEQITQIGNPASNYFPIGLPNLQDEITLTNTYARLSGDLSVVGSDFLTNYSDAQNANELAEQLSELKSEGRLPQLAAINVNDQLVTSIVGDANARGAYEQNIKFHVVLVEDYDEDLDTVTIRNPLNGAQPINVSLEDFSNALRTKPLDKMELTSKTFTDGVNLASGELSSNMLQLRLASLPEYQRKEYLNEILSRSGKSANEVLTDEQQERLGLSERLNFLERLGAQLGI